MCMFNYCLSKNHVHFYAASYYIKWTRLPGHTVPSFIEESDYAADSEFEEGRENLNNREGETYSTYTSGDKYHFTWTRKGIRFYPKFYS